MSALAVCGIASVKTQTCAFSSHFFSSKNKRAVSSPVIFMYQLGILYTSGPVATGEQSALSRARMVLVLLAKFEGEPFQRKLLTIECFA